VCSFLQAFVPTVHDAMPDQERERFKRFIFRLMGSRDTPEKENERGLWIRLQAFTVWLPMALEAAGLPELANEFRLCARFDRTYGDLLAKAEKITEPIPMVRECVEAAVRICDRKKGAAAAYASASLASVIMALNDDTARLLMLGRRPVRKVPEIYDVIIDAIDKALRLGRQGQDPDPWEVLDAAERCRAFYGKKPLPRRKLPFAIEEPGPASA
jgi:hypothetical protein